MRQWTIGEPEASSLLGIRKIMKPATRKGEWFWFVLEGRNDTARQPTRIHGRKSARGVSFRSFNVSLLQAKARKVRPARDRMIMNS